MINWLFFYLAVLLLLLLVTVVGLWFALRRMQFRERVWIISLLVALIIAASLALWMNYR